MQSYNYEVGTRHCTTLADTWKEIGVGLRIALKLGFRNL